MGRGRQIVYLQAHRCSLMIMYDPEVHLKVEANIFDQGCVTFTRQCVQVLQVTGKITTFDYYPNRWPRRPRPGALIYDSDTFILA